MKDYTAQYLDWEVLHRKHAPACLTADGERVGQNGIERFAFGQLSLELFGHAAQLIVAHFFIFRFKLKHLVLYRLNTLDLLLAVISEDLLDNTHFVLLKKYRLRPIYEPHIAFPFHFTTHLTKIKEFYCSFYLFY